MEDEVIVTETTVEEPIGDSTRQELEALLTDLLPEEKQGSVEEMALAWIKEQLEMNNRLATALGEDPRFASAAVDVMNGSNGVASLVRYYGRDFFDAKEGTPEYEALMASENTYRQEREQVKKDQEEFDNKAGAFFNKFREYCDKNGLVFEEYIGKIMEKVLGPVMGWEASDEVFDRLVKAVDYEKDTEDAYVAGQISGRNMNINEMRMKPTDGMPKGLSSQAAPAPERPKRKVNSLIEKALNA